MGNVFKAVIWEEYYQDLRSYERKIEQDRLEYEQDRRSLRSGGK